MTVETNINLKYIHIYKHFYATTYDTLINKGNINTWQLIMESKAMDKYGKFILTDIPDMMFHCYYISAICCIIAVCIQIIGHLLHLTSFNVIYKGHLNSLY
jgi:hypothetical protein